MKNSHPKFIETILSALNNAPTFLSFRNTMNMVASISAVASSSKQKPSAILHLILPDGMSPILSNQRDKK